MPDTLLITGGTGLTGSTIALRAAAQGRRVRVLVRNDRELKPLRSAGIDIAIGDVTTPATLKRAMQGVSHVVNAAAVLSGTWVKAGPEEMWNVNHRGALNVLDAARAAGVKRCVHLDSNSIWDAEHAYTERSPLILPGPLDSPYVSAKRAAYTGALHRAMQGQDIVFVTPGAIYGPGVFVERALDQTSFTSVALRGILGQIESFISYPMPWTYVSDLADVVLAALDHGDPAHRYLAMGRDEDVSSLAAFCNLAAEIAGSSHRVRDIDPHAPGAPDIGTMRQFIDRKYASPLVVAEHTNEVLGTTPTSKREALTTTIEWLRAQGKLPEAANA